MSQTKGSHCSDFRMLYQRPFSANPLSSYRPKSTNPSNPSSSPTPFIHSPFLISPSNSPQHIPVHPTSAQSSSQQSSLTQRSSIQSQTTDVMLRRRNRLEEKAVSGPFGQLIAVVPRPYSVVKKEKEEKEENEKQAVSALQLLNKNINSSIGAQTRPQSGLRNNETKQESSATDPKTINNNMNGSTLTRKQISVSDIGLSKDIPIVMQLEEMMKNKKDQSFGYDSGTLMRSENNNAGIDNADTVLEFGSSIIVTASKKKQR
ncbi:MAG: hypothetical protein EZS28_000457 [Streblomastix strix]|uniref:Uncharacterized protein n=1 Tax=Streblomastix strix TaxID=222440 RepID=A0A5J4XB40_9EUKA|nr:MAG: hypothetical protein EZS28_000457 [Streblomastix strix]